VKILGTGGGQAKTAAVALPFDSGSGSRLIEVAFLDSPMGRCCLWLDENHAQALVLALQAAIAEVQARAVSL